MLRIIQIISISVGVGISAIADGNYKKEQSVAVAQELLRTLDKMIFMDEDLQDTVTATSGSVPAVFLQVRLGDDCKAVAVSLSEADAHTLFV